jgi:hypothetical protein
MKKLFFILMPFILISCYKNDIEALNKQVVQFQHKLDSLSNTLTANTNILQKSADSLSQALALTNSKISQTSLSIAAAIKTNDSISTQLKAINTQISSLKSQLLNANANVTSISAQITTLNQQYADLLIKYNSLLSLITTYPFNTIRDGLVAYYPFTGNANDSSGNKINGTVQGASLTADRFGNLNSAYNFNGTSNYIVLSNTFLNGAIVTQMSYSIWFKIASYPSSGNAYTLSDKNAYWRQVQMFIGSNGGINFWWTYPNPQAYYGTYSSVNIVTLNKWNNYTVVLNGNILNAYLNGNLITSFIQNSNNGSIDFSYLTQGNSTSTNLIGVQNSLSPGFQYYFNGQIDDLRVYNRTLTTNEIAYLNLN